MTNPEDALEAVRLAAMQSREADRACLAAQMTYDVASSSLEVAQENERKARQRMHAAVAELQRSFDPPGVRGEALRDAARQASCAGDLSPRRRVTDSPQA